MQKNHFFTNFLEAARIELKEYGILVTSILPGFIDTPINHHMRERPYLIDSKKAAVKIVNTIEKKKETAFIPFYPWAILHSILKFMPDFLYYSLKDKLMRDK